MRTNLSFPVVALVAALLSFGSGQQGHAQYQSYAPNPVRAHGQGIPPGYAQVGPGWYAAQPAAYQAADEAEPPVPVPNGRKGGYANGGSGQASSGNGCGQGSCGSGCDQASCGGDCEPPVWAHRNGFFGEFLYMRPRDAEITYGVPFNGPVDSPPKAPIQIAGLGVVDMDYKPAFRVGLVRACNDCASLRMAYTHFDGSTTDAISTVAPFAIRSMVAHPSTLQAGSDGLDASAYFRLDLDRVDVDYRTVIASGELSALNFVAGGAYAGLQQHFRSRYAVNGVETVRTDVFFNGGGIRLGLEGERHGCSSGWMVYANGAATFVAGEFDARFAQGQAFDARVVDTSWKAGRVVTILDAEVGVGWQSCNGCFRFTAGYLFSAWYNTVKTDEFINAVQGNNFVRLGDTLTFDGLAMKAEIRY